MKQSPCTPSSALTLRAALLTTLLCTLVGCATPVLDDAARLARAGRHDEALALLAQQRQRDPADPALRAAELRLRESALARHVLQAETARSADRLDEALAELERARAIDAKAPRVQALATELARAQRRALALQAARAALAGDRLDDAEARTAQLLAEEPGDPAARELQRLLRERRPPLPAAPALTLATRISLEFRDAPLRNVLEGLARTHGINFVFDKDVRADTRINVLLRDTPLAEGLRIILSTQQLASKALNERTLLIYPDTGPKRAEHRELVTRGFYLANADVKQAQALVKTMAKTRDVFVDERLNVLMVRDTPEVVRLVERLLAGIDVAEPEVVLEVEVLEIGSSQLDELGIQWPDQVSYGLPGAGATVELAQRGNFRSSVANPALLASLRETVTRSNTLANPRLRARNREKAKVLVGEKLPVFTTTTNVNGSSATVSYLDVGLKLEVEPNVLLEGDVVMKVALEVSTLIGRVAGPQGAVGYQVGTREASTSLRLRNGETQILAGLIRDEDSKTIAGLPGASSLPLLGRLFGLHTDQRAKTEVVLLITPRVVRTVVPPDGALGNAPGGSETNPGEQPWRLSASAGASVPVRAGRPTAGTGGVADSAAVAAAAEAPPALQMAATASTRVGQVATVTLANRSGAVVEGELLFDAAQLAPVQPGLPGAGPGRAAFRIEAGRDHVLPLRVLAAAAGQTLSVTVGNLSATGAGGESRPLEVAGSANITVAPAP